MRIDTISGVKPSLFFALFLPAAFGQSLTCDLQEYKPMDGLRAESRNGALELSWDGTHGQQLRAGFAIRGGQPTITEFSARKAGGAWVVLGRNLTPEFEVVSGKRRLSEQQMAPLRALGIALTPEVVEREKWNAFWDAPLMVPGAPKTNLDLPRKPEEIRRASASYQAASCKVKTDGARIELEFPGLSMGIFAGSLRYTVYKGTNLLRQEAIAKTEEQSVAYKYNAGLKGFAVADGTKVVWRDVARAWQQYGFGGAVNNEDVALRARNRLGIVESGGGSLAFLPPSHKFFFARELETNLGFVYYRKDSETSFAVGARQAEREEPYRPYGVSDEEWTRRANEARHDINNFALYNAPPGTWQRMPVYFYLSPDDSHATQEAVLAFTHDDTYKPMPGFQVLVSHFHFHWNEALTDAGSMDQQPPWLQVFRALGINIAILADFHSDSHPNDPGPVRFKEQKVYFDGCRRFSDRGFLLVPGEEPDATLGGHYITFMPRPVYWSHVRQDGQQFVENDPQYGKVYHIGSQAEELDMLRRENGLMWQAHPRTKGSSGYPDAVRDKAHFLSDRFLGGSYQSLPVDQSQKRICEVRCLDLMDEMNNWGVDPKYLIAEGDTYMKYPDDETFPQLIVNYVKLPRVPRFDEDWTPIERAMRAGDYFVSSGEVLLRNWSIEGTGARRTYNAEVEWTFPLEFVEIVWGDGKTTGRQVIPATELQAFGSKKFQIPFDTAGKKWVRFGVWDSAGNGAFTQPVRL
jgi:hypothetical protein